MPVFRVVKNANYTTMSNYHLKDRLLSLKGKGLQSMLLSLPEKWRYSVNGLTEICLEGRDSVNATLQELEQRGYLVRKQTRMPDGRLGGVEYWIYEKPQPCGDSPCTENPDTAQPDADEPFTENPGQLRTNKSNTQESITKERKRLSRHRYGQYQNVLLSDDELDKLRTEFPADWQQRIERLSEYIASSGKTYKNHLVTIRSWARRDAASQKQQGYSHENYQFKEGDSL